MWLKEEREDLSLLYAMTTHYAVDACLICRERLIVQILPFKEPCQCHVCNQCGIAFVLSRHSLLDGGSSPCDDGIGRIDRSDDTALDVPNPEVCGGEFGSYGDNSQPILPECGLDRHGHRVPCIEGDDLSPGVNGHSGGGQTSWNAGCLGTWGGTLCT